MKIDTICPICRKDEDGGHLFFKCKYAKTVWRDLCLEHERDTLAPLLSPWDVTSTILQLKGSKPVRVVILMWFLWSERNAVRENGHGRSAEILARSIRIYSEEIIRGSTRQGQARERRTDKWHRSPAGVLKLNCDASYKAAERSGSWGFVTRDNDGDVVMTGRGRINHLLSPFQAEVIACLQGIQTALNLGIGKLILETDALLIKQALASTEVCDRPEEGLVNELKFLVSTNFIHFECVFQGRDCNRVAHELASLGYDCVEGNELISSSIPEHIAVIVAADLSADK